jgi:uncharacterized protein with HEPN domain
MRREPRAFLWDVREAAANIERFVATRTYEQFADDVLVRSAVERQFEIIGEALSQLARIAPDIAAQVPDVARIVAFRNILIHGYAVLDYPTVWKVIHESLPSLRDAVQRLLGPTP